MTIEERFIEIINNTLNNKIVKRQFTSKDYFLAGAKAYRDCINEINLDKID